MIVASANRKNRFRLHLQIAGTAMVMGGLFLCQPAAVFAKEDTKDKNTKTELTGPTDDQSLNDLLKEAENLVNPKIRGRKSKALPAGEIKKPPAAPEKTRKVKLEKPAPRVRKNSLGNYDYRPKHWTDPATGIALGGIDPIAYFELQTLETGSEEYEFEWQGVSWRFMSKGNMQAFARSPQLYAPVFAGFDAYAVSQGILSEGLPSIWAISEGRLYLFHTPVNRHLWFENMEQLKPVVRKNWRRLSLDLPRHKVKINQ